MKEIVLKPKKKLDEEGRLHCENGPALSYNKYIKEYFIHGVRHRDDGPAVIWVDPNMMLHRIQYWKNGILHREENSEPAEILIINYRHIKPEETHKYYYHGRLHRTNGPAVQHYNKDDVNEYWVDGECVEEQEYKTAVLKYKIKNILNKSKKNLEM